MKRFIITILCLSSYASGERHQSNEPNARRQRDDAPPRASRKSFPVSADELRAEFPWLVRVRTHLKDGGTGSCTGILFGRSCLVTVGRCADENVDSFDVSRGDGRRVATGRRGGYLNKQAATGEDLAVIKLDNDPGGFDQNHDPAQVFASPEEVAAAGNAARFTSVGYGAGPLPQASLLKLKDWNRRGNVFAKGEVPNEPGSPYLMNGKVVAIHSASHGESARRAHGTPTFARLSRIFFDVSNRNLRCGEPPDNGEALLNRLTDLGGRPPQWNTQKLVDTFADGRNAEELARIKSRIAGLVGGTEKGLRFSVGKVDGARAFTMELEVYRDGNHLGQLLLSQRPSLLGSSKFTTTAQWKQNVRAE